MTNTKSAGALPVYLQISEALIRDIAAGRLRDGMRLPPERAHCQELGTSIGTLRKALNVLEEKGLLHRVQGSGNYIRAHSAVPSIYSLHRLERHGGGGLPRASLLSVEQADKPPHKPDIGPSATGWRFRRLRYLDDQPAAMEEIWIDARHAKRIVPQEVSESLYLFYRDKLDLQVVSVEDHISVGVMPSWSDPRLTPKPGDACGYVCRTGFDAQGHAIEASETWYDHHCVHYISRLGKS